MRVENNKYPNEADIWYLYEWYNFNRDRDNSIECLNFLNKMWNIPDEELHIYLNANVHTDLKFVRYPLPEDKRPHVTHCQCRDCHPELFVRSNY